MIVDHQLPCVRQRAQWTWRFGIRITALAIVTALVLLRIPLARAAPSTPGKGAEPQPLEYRNGVFWWIHLSDVHISAHVPLRTRELEEHFIEALRILRPPLLLITGDLTDAKNKFKTTTSQNESEWKTYARMLRRMQTYCAGRPGQAAEECPIRILDLRGNHDTLEVPHRGANGDFYPLYSTTSRAEDTPVRFVKVEPKEKDLKYPPILFTMFDVAPRVGLRGPSNFFAHPLDSDAKELNAVLSNQSNEGAVKVVLGHYPLSFTARTESGVLAESIFLNNHIDAYLAGHLHYKFGTRMYRWHHVAKQEHIVTKLREGGGFWELGTGDWRDSRAMRVMAVDHGRITFAEFCLLPPVWIRPKGAPQQNQTSMLHGGAPLVLLTYPPDPRFAPRTAAPSIEEHSSSQTPVLIRALVFSSSEIQTVEAQVIATGAAGMPLSRQGSPWNPCISTATKRQQEPSELGSAASKEAQRPRNHGERLVERVVLHPSDHGVPGAPPLYSGTWNASSYAAAEQTLLWIRVAVTDVEGRVTVAEPRPFLVGVAEPGDPQWVEIHQTWLERTMMGTDWEGLWPLTRWAPFLLLWALLLISKGAHLWVHRRAAVGHPKTGSSIPRGPARRASSGDLGRSEAGASRMGCNARCGEQGVPADVTGPCMTACLASSPDSESGSEMCTPGGLCLQLLVLPLRVLGFVTNCYIRFAGSTAWWLTLVYSIYLAFCPWFWGLPLGPRCALGHLSLSGWTVPDCTLPDSAEAPGSSAGAPLLHQAVPDVVTIIVPTLYLSLLPMLLWLPLFLGRACCLVTRGSPVAQVGNRPHHGSNCVQSDDAQAESESSAEIAPLLAPQHLDASSSVTSARSCCDGRNKKSRRRMCGCGDCCVTALLCIFPAVPLFVYLHQCKAMYGAFGASAVFMSPGLAWFPAIIAFTISWVVIFEGVKFPCKED